MGEDICRAITFISYHIPMAMEQAVKIPYSTIGFFDGMLTERLAIDYEKQDLKQLWRYCLKCTVKSRGRYSYQNIFGFSRDQWNQYSDEEFWRESINERYPLTFVVFLQLRQYKTKEASIEKQCMIFNNAICKMLHEKGMYYTYCTVDKNDFVVCIKCRKYEEAVKAIKNLHETGNEVVYSYSVFSVSSVVLERLQGENYADIFAEDIYSICLKGITNSFDPEHKFSLDRKYYEFCHKLLNNLYGNDKSEADYMIYDILGDDDFRLIARHVKLGALLRQFADGGMLCYKEKEFRFYLFSSSLVLNTETPAYSQIREEDKTESTDRMQQEFQAPICNALKTKMTNIAQRISTEAGENLKNEKIVTFCHAIWQLMQSLRALEVAPTKRYDFYSIYQPLSLMIQILEEKMQKDSGGDIGENAEIYDFVHKISMTLHGTLRTDIQFFQIRDFNAVVHYAPAKLRAFYSLWALKLSDYYNEFCTKKNTYSFIFSPGMFRETSVKQLFTNYEEDKRLMLITVPERHLYSPRWLAIILTHEVSHFVGYTVRNREKRHEIWLEACARVLHLEMSYYRRYVSAKKWKNAVEKALMHTCFFEDMKQRLHEEEKIIRAQDRLWPHEFHSENSIKTIEKAFGNIGRKYIEKIISDDCERLHKLLREEENVNRLAFKERIKIAEEIRRVSFDVYPQLLGLYHKFQYNLLPQLLGIFRYVASEAYADLTAILTLNLLPKEYLLSFTRGELNLDTGSADQENGVMLVVRVGIIIEAMQNIAESELHKGQSIFARDFLEKWSKDAAANLVFDFQGDLEEFIALQIYSYVTSESSDPIREYRPIYEYEQEVQDFAKRKLDCFNDPEIKQLFTSYLDKCAKDYVNILECSQILQDRRKALVSLYQNLAGGSVIEIAQEIEDFLAAYEDEENARNGYKK